MVKVSCPNRECRLCRRGECTADKVTVVMDEYGYMQIDCPEVTVKQG